MIEKHAEVKPLNDLPHIAIVSAAKEGLRRFSIPAEDVTAHKHGDSWRITAKVPDFPPQQFGKPEYPVLGYQELTFAEIVKQGFAVLDYQLA